LINAEAKVRQVLENEEEMCNGVSAWEHGQYLRKLR